MSTATIGTVHTIGPQQTVTPATVKPRKASKAAKPPRLIPIATRKQREEQAALGRQARSALFIFFVAISVAALSLSHQAFGIGMLTPRSAYWEWWAMAIGIDGSFMAVEIGQVTSVGEELLAKNKWLGRFIIIVTMAFSAALNALAFGAGANADSLLWYPAVGLGLALPGIIYGLTRYGTNMWLMAKQRTRAI